MQSAESSEIDWYPRSLALQILGISDKTLYLYAKGLKEALTPEEFDYQDGEWGFSRTSMKALTKLVALRRQGMSKKRALEKIKLEGV